MPPEFFRKGRFDELFLVELPDADERRNIFKIHLAKRNQLGPQVDIIKLIEPTKGYSGADIESVVKEAVEMAFCETEGERIITTDTLLDVIKNTKSITDTLGEKIEKLREVHKKYSFKNANGKVTFPTRKACVNAKNNKGLPLIDIEAEVKHKRAVGARIAKDFPVYLVMEGTILTGHTTDLPKKLVIPEGVTSIGDNAFYNCTSLMSVEIPSSVTRIGQSAFLNCNSLTSVEIHDGVKIIENNAFTRCWSLGSVKIPKSVTNIGHGIFGGCKNSVYYCGTKVEWKRIVGHGNVSHVTVYCTDGDIIQG